MFIDDELIILNSVSSECIKREYFIKRLTDLLVNSYNDEGQELTLREDMKETLNRLIDKIKKLNEVEFNNLISSLPLIASIE